MPERQDKLPLQQLRELKGFATQGYNNGEVRNIQAMMQI
jgi:hypothetical protein